MTPRVTPAIAFLLCLAASPTLAHTGDTVGGFMGGLAHPAVSPILCIETGVERILFRFTKGEPVRFVGHLDLMRVFERAMRRSDFPIAYSQGFNPRPRMSFASGLTLGATSEWELCQLDLARDLSRAEIEAAVEQLRTQLPPGSAFRMFGRFH